MKTATLILSLLILVSGCSSVPQTEISYSPGLSGGAPKFNIKAPKDSDIQGVEYSRSNNVVNFKIRSYRARMNPDVIAAQGQRELDIINSVGNVVAQGAATALQAYTSGGGSLVGRGAPVGSSRPVGGSPTNVPPERFR